MLTPTTSTSSAFIMLILLLALLLEPNFAAGQYPKGTVQSSFNTATIEDKSSSILVSKNVVVTAYCFSTTTCYYYLFAHTTSDRSLFLPGPCFLVPPRHVDKDKNLTTTTTSLEERRLSSTVTKSGKIRNCTGRKIRFTYRCCAEKSNGDRVCTNDQNSNKVSSWSAEDFSVSDDSTVTTPVMEIKVQAKIGLNWQKGKYNFLRPLDAACNDFDSYSYSGKGWETIYDEGFYVNESGGNVNWFGVRSAECNILDNCV